MRETSASGSEWSLLDQRTGGIAPRSGASRLPPPPLHKTLRGPDLGVNKEPQTQRQRWEGETEEGCQLTPTVVKPEFWWWEL